MMRVEKIDETATTAPRGARAFVRETLSGWDGTTRDAATTLVSEITTVSMAVSGAAAVRISIVRTSDKVRIEVHEPAIRSESGRYDDVPAHSEDLVASIADRWGIDDEPRGRVVWFELDARPLV